MILTFLYVIATSVQSRRISFLKGHLRILFQGGTSGYPSVILYNKLPTDSHKDSKSSLQGDHESNEKFTTSSLCVNKHEAKLGELLWFRDEMTLCTIYPQQRVELSNWISYETGRTTFPLFMNNSHDKPNDCEHGVFVLIEADLESFEPDLVPNATKIEDYGLIVCWIANKNIGLIVQSDLDNLTKLLIAAMEGFCYINNGLLLRRIETVHVSGTPCSYSDNPPSASPDRKFLGQADWVPYIEKLRALSDSAKVACEQGHSIDVPDYPGLTVYPEGGNTVEATEPPEALGSGIKSCVSTPASLNLPQEETLPEGKSENIAGQSNISKVETPVKTPVETVIKQRTPEKPAALKLPEKTDNETESTVVSKEQVQPLAKGAPRVYTKASPDRSVVEMATRLNGRNMKSPNVLIYSDSDVERTNVKNVLEESLGSNKRYAIYNLSLEEMKHDAWMENAALVVACGNVGSEIGNQLVEYILRGGKLLALCSDVLHALLPDFKTAEVRENELVHFSYGKWKHVRMMHHIFCYQASPIRTRFSQEQEDVKFTNPTPACANIKDKRGKLHSFDIRVLGTEETWHSPSILLATLPETDGRVVFSQIHLEIDPMQYQFEETKFIALKESNSVRLEIFNDLLETHLDIEVNDAPAIPAAYTPAFFLGRHELKLEMLERLKSIMQSNETLRMRKLEVQFCRGNTTPRHASSSYLPIMLHQCPEDFSTIEYFENLTSKELGRLVIYADIMTSTMDVLTGCKLQHGLTVITRQQTRGRGRGKNIWLSPKGCCMFSMQLHIPTDSVMGNRITMLQQLVAVAIVHAIRSLPGYQDIDLNLKWPNDIYACGKAKVGGILVTSQIESSVNICNIGVGMNVFNSEPTCCINDLIKIHNDKHRQNLKMISFEQFFAIVFNEIEKLLNSVQGGSTQAIVDVYYKYWMHEGAEVTVLSALGKSQTVKILGIDSYGFLLVRGADGRSFTVHPDGNSFDPLKGLIAPK